MWRSNKTSRRNSLQSLFRGQGRKSSAIRPRRLNLEPLEVRALLSFTPFPTPIGTYTGGTTDLAALIPANGTPVTSLNDGAETVGFSASVSAGTVGTTWATWNTPPAVESATPRILEDVGATSLTMTLSKPADVSASKPSPRASAHLI